MARDPEVKAALEDCVWALYDMNEAGWEGSTKAKSL
jgi:hypothetical protein